MSEAEHWSAGLQAEPGFWPPPPELVAWAQTCKTPERAWSRCKDGSWLLWALAHTGADHCTLVLSACDCARQALPLVPAGDDRPLVAIEGAEAWARWEESCTSLDDARHLIIQACDEALAEGGHPNVHALFAARYALQAIWNPQFAHQAALSAVQALGDVPRPRRWSRVVLPSKKTRAVQAAQVELIRSRPYPLLQPDLHARGRARASLQVAWDLLAERTPSDLTELSTTQVLCSWWTARSLGLDPKDELARALAQRLQLVPELRGQVAAILQDLRGCDA